MHDQKGYHSFLCFPLKKPTLFPLWWFGSQKTLGGVRPPPFHCLVSIRVTWVNWNGSMAEKFADCPTRDCRPQGPTGCCILSYAAGLFLPPLTPLAVAWYWCLALVLSLCEASCFFLIFGHMGIKMRCMTGKDGLRFILGIFFCKKHGFCKKNVLNGLISSK